MKKKMLCLITLVLLLPAATACAKFDYCDYISDERSDLFCAETEDYKLTVSCRDRENPFLLDGVPAQKSKTVEVVLAETVPTGAEYEVYFLDDSAAGGDMSFRSVSGDYAYSRSVDAFPSGSVSLRVVKDGVKEEVVATSVKSEKTISVREALEKAVAAEHDTVAKMRSGKVFHGEFHVRLLKRDRTYYYVGILDGKSVLSLLLDAETGEVLARRLAS